MSTLLSNQNRKTKHYQTDQQVKYLYLEAEVEMLLQKLTILKGEKELLIKLSSESSKSVELNID